MLSRIYSNLRRNNFIALQQALYASNQGPQKTPMDQGSFGTKGQEYYGKKPEDIKSSGKRSEDVGKQMENKFQDWKEKVEDKGQSIKEELQKDASYVKQSVQQKEKDAKDVVQDKVQDVKEAVQDKAQDLKEGAKNMANFAAEKGKEFVNQASDSMKQKGQDSMQGMKNLKDTAKDDLNDMKDKAKSYGNQAYHMGAAGAEQVKREVKDKVDQAFSSDRSWTQQAKETAENLTGIHSTKDLKEKISDVAEKAKETISSWVGGSTNSKESQDRQTDTTKDFNREKMDKKKQ